MKRLFTLMIALLSMLIAWQSARAANVVFNVTVPTPTYQVWIVGNFQGWNPAAMVQGVKVDDTHFTVTLDDATFASGVTLANLEYKYSSGNGSWAYIEKTAQGEELPANRKYSDSNGTDVVASWASVYNPSNLQDVNIEVLTPLTTIECYITGTFNNWASPSAATKMTKAETTTEGVIFKTTLKAVDPATLEFKFASGPAWDYEQSQAANFKYSTDGGTVVVSSFKLIFDPSKTGDIHITATVPAGTDSVWIQGSFIGWDMTKAVKGTKNADGTFSFTVPLVISIEYRLYNRPDWSHPEVDETGAERPNRKAVYPDDANISITVVNWKIPMGISQIKEATNLIYTRNSSIVVEGVTSRVDIFDVTGRLLQSGKKAGTFISKSLKSGIYVVKVDGGTKKVTLK
ncbi:MAG: T9SS type A sorting domain-containing protein [Methylococcaceae bacterium]|nr:T9SS type A sorting domain-containing protein [Prolixibacteraceae bacterium]